MHVALISPADKVAPGGVPFAELLFPWAVVGVPLPLLLGVQVGR